jgi:hypothetical protein
LYKVFHPIIVWEQAKGCGGWQVGTGDVIDGVGEIEGVGPGTSILEYIGQRGPVEGILEERASGGITLSAGGWRGLIQGHVEAACQGVIRKDGVCLRVGGEQEAVGGQHPIVRGVVQGYWPCEVVGLKGAALPFLVALV